MSVRKRQDKWIVDIDFEHPDGRRERVRKLSPVQTKRGAEQYERELRTALASGIRQKRKEAEAIPSFEKFSELFIASYAMAANKPSEVNTKQGHLKRYLIPGLGSMRLDQIKTRDIEALKGRLMQTKLKAKTINNALTTLNKMLRYAVDLEILEVAPQVRKLKAEKPDFDFLSFPEADQLLEGATYNPEWYAMIYLALRTGLRYGELCELRWHDLDLNNGKMRVCRSYYRGHVTSPKSNKERTLPLSKKTVAFLKQHRHLKGELVFCKDDGGRHIHRRADVALKRCCKKAGLRPISWHVLRHSFASHLVMKGIHLKVVQEFLGHYSIAMTERYSHLSPDVNRQAVEVLDETTPRLAAAL